MSTTLIVSLIFAVIVFIGSIIHSKRDKDTINWYLVILYTAVAFAGVWAIHGLELLFELGE